MRPIKFNEYGEDWVVIPVEGYGNQDILRSIVRNYRPDMILFISDPRFYYWLWQMENEIRPLCPLIYYNIWDNYPYPTFNKVLYESNDVLVPISKLTEDINSIVAPNVYRKRIPHSVDMEVFKKLDPIQVDKFKQENFQFAKDKFVFFWNNRNARRKMSGAIIWWFKEFLDKVGYDKAMLIMHTDPKDPNGQELVAIIKELKLDQTKSVLLSTEKIQPNVLAMLYNASDCGINISNAEGFGLSAIETLCCEKPMIVTMTGGMQEQITDLPKVTMELVEERKLNSEKVLILEHGIGIIPSTSNVIGGQDVPFIYEDCVSKESFIKALEIMINLPKEQRDQMGKNAREYFLKNYNHEDNMNKWDELMQDVHQKFGSWETRKLYKTWEMRTL